MIYSPASFECCRKKEKPYGKLELPVKCSRINTFLQAAAETKTGSAAALPTSQLVQVELQAAASFFCFGVKMLNSLISWDCWTASCGGTQGFQEPVAVMEWPWPDCYFSSSIQMYRALKCLLFLGFWMYSWWRFSFQPLQFSNSSVLISLFFLNIIYFYLILHLFPRTLSRNIIAQITVASARK